MVKNLKNLGKIIHIALINSWIATDLFVGYKGKSKQVDRYYLTREEIDRTAVKQFISDRLTQVHDVFLLSYFTGLAI